MRVNHRQSSGPTLGRVGASLLVRDCSKAVPGGWQWQQWNCGPVSTAASTLAPPPAPIPSAPVRPDVPPPAVVRVEYDAALAAQLQANENARVSAQLAAEEAARIAAQEAAASQAARDEAARLRAAADASMRAVESSGAGSASFLPSSGDVAFDASTLNADGESSQGGMVALIALALAGVAVLTTGRKRR